ncbi:SDR family oxidoreductase [Nonomuraea fastidiosa]|uniref:SDR family oxidoreductase n=1 Tax=Nonomuraea fastidiosa TaxID=46173 RepID=UPI00366FC550
MLRGVRQGRRPRPRGPHRRGPDRPDDPGVRHRRAEGPLPAGDPARRRAVAPCDVTSEAQVLALLDATVEAHGRLDVLVNNAGLGGTAPLAMHPLLAKVTDERLPAEPAAKEAFRRAAEPWEVANVIVFLASDYSSYMTGEVISVSSQHP